MTVNPFMPPQENLQTSSIQTSPETNSIPVLFFSRGRGHGHAIPDMDIGQELNIIDKSINIQFVSYATGAETFKACNVPVLDMGLPEGNPFILTLQKALELITNFKPKIIVAHEEFAAMAAAKITGVPAIFISAWMPQNGTVHAESLVSAAGILVIGDPGIFPMPMGVRGTVAYSGPIVRKLQFTRKDRSSLRRELNIEDDALAILVAQGGWASEQRAPILNTVLSAFFALKQTPKHLFWLAGNDVETISRRMQGMKGVHVLPFVDPMERIMAACDIVITKGTRGITLDAASAGVPSISLSPGMNPIDDMLVPRIRTNIALNANATDGTILKQYMEKVIAAPCPAPLDIDAVGNARVAAQHLLTMIRKVASESTSAKNVTNHAIP